MRPDRSRAFIHWSLCTAQTLPAILILLTALALSAALPGQALAAGQPWDASPLLVDALNASLSATSKEVDALPSGDQATAASNARRAILERRQVLLQQLLAALKSTQGFSQQLATLKQAGKTDTRPSRPAGDSAAAVDIDANIDADIDQAKVNAAGLDQLRSKLEQARSQVTELSGQLQKIRERLDTLPELLDSARQNAQASAKTVSRLATDSSSGDSAELLLLQQENAALAAVTSKQTISSLQAEQALLKQQAPSLSAQLDNAKNQLTPLKARFSAYSEVLQKQQTEQAQQLTETAKRKQQLAAQAQAPAERMLADAEAELALVKRDSAELTTVSTQLGNKMLEMENDLKRDQGDLAELRGMVAAVGSDGPAADMLRQLYADIERRRRELNETLPAHTSERIKDAVRAVVSNQRRLSQINRQWQARIAELPAADRAAADFNEHATALQNSLRNALHDKGDLLRNVSREGRKLQTLPSQRLAVLNELEAFVLSNVLWMQDARPLDSETFTTARAELFSPSRNNSLLNWWQQFQPGKALHQMGEVFGHIYSSLIALPMLLIIPILLWWSIHNGRRSQRSFFRNLLATTLLPAYLLSIAALLKPGGEQFYSAFVTSKLLIVLAAIVQVWLLSRVFFHPDGIAVQRFRMPAELAASLRRTLNIWAIGALLLLVPAYLLKAPPFEFTATPRLLYTGMELLVLATLIALLRPRSALMSALFSEQSRHHLGQSQRREQAHRFLQRHWATISALISAFLIGVVLLDMLGFRYTANRLSQSVVLTVVIVAAMLAAYWVLVATLNRFMWQRLSVPADAPSTDAETDPKRLERQVKRGLRGLLTLAGAMLVALAWNLGSGDTLPLQGIQLYSVVADDGTRDYVTAANMVDFLLVLILTGWLLRELKTLFELLIFPHLRMDRGKRYALVTLSRYLLFIIGAIIALKILRINLGNLGWLVAAMGVGLGFGLQEIFANFVSGLILLVERPIRVGDLVTVGNVMGNVTHISFRATTVAAFDNEEILIPNKELITGQVTNWTLGNTITRITIPIQAAYGSDVDKVSDILMEIASNDPEVLSDPAPAALFMAHADSGLDFELRVFLGTSGVRLSTRDRINRAVNKAFASHGIEIPYPQRDLHIRSLQWPDSMTRPANPSVPPPPASEPIDPNAQTGEDIA